MHSLIRHGLRRATFPQGKAMGLFHEKFKKLGEDNWIWICYTNRIYNYVQ